MTEINGDDGAIELLQESRDVISEFLRRLSNIDVGLAINIARFLLAARDDAMDAQTRQNIQAIIDVLGRLPDAEDGVTIKEYLKRILRAVDGSDESLGTGAVLSAISAFTGLARDTNFGNIPPKEPDLDGTFVPTELWYGYGLVNQSGVWRYTYYTATQSANNSGYWFRLLRQWVGWDIHLVWPRGRLPIGSYAIETRRVFVDGSEDSNVTSSFTLEFVDGVANPYGYSLQNTIPSSPFSGTNVQYALGRLRFIPQSAIPAGETPYTLIGIDERYNPAVLYLTPSTG